MWNKVYQWGSLLGLAGVLVVAPNAVADDQYQVGCDNYAKGDFAAARTAFQEALKSRAKAWQVHYQLANTLLQLRDAPAAKAEYQQTLALTPDAAVKAQCQSAIRYLSLNKTLPAVEPEGPKPTIIKPGEDDDDEATPVKAAPPPATTSAEEAHKRTVEAQKAQIMRKANYEVDKVRRDVSAQIQSDSDRETEIKSSGDARIEKIMKEARDKADQVH
ncbi:MAG TPA: tetratricopeptide repeat protein [Chroococcales cyanobacterium]